MPIMSVNKLKASPKTISIIMEKYIDDEYFLFDKIIPQPNTIRLGRSLDTVDAILYTIVQMDDDKLTELERKISEKGIDKFFISKYLMSDKPATLVELKHNISENDLERLKKLSDNYEPHWYEKKLGLDIKSYIDLGNIYINNLLQYGYIDDIDWGRANWGTASTGYIYESDESCLTFDTEHTPPIEIVKKLSKEFSNDTFQLLFKTNDGLTSGKYVLEDGNITMSDIKCENSELFDEEEMELE